MTFAERFRQIADMLFDPTVSKEEFRNAFDTAFEAIDGHPEEDTLFKCLVEAASGEKEIPWAHTTFIPDSIKNEGFWTRHEGGHTSLSFDVPPENSTTAEITA